MTPTLPRTLAVRILLQTRWNYLPGPPTAKLDGARPGPAASRYVPCDYCAGQGWLNGVQPCRQLGDHRKSGKHNCRLCPTCDGTKQRVARAGDEPWDAYAGTAVTELEQAVRQAREEEARRASRRPLANPVETGYRWETDRARLEAQGSYRDLDRALEWLRDRHPIDHETVGLWLQHVASPQLHWFAMDRSLGRALKRLAGRMPSEIRVPHWAVPEKEEAA